jgi:hypothetical protein
MIELDNRAVRPEALPNRPARDHFTGRFEEHSEDLEWLLLKSDPVPVLMQFSPSKVEFKRAKAHI